MSGVQQLGLGASQPQFDERGQRVPPHDMLAEQSALGGAMLSKEAAADVLECVRPADFYIPKHENILKAIAALHAREEPTDVIAVTDELTKTGWLTRSGGADYLHTLTGLVPTSANAGFYASIVAEKAVMRRLVEVGTRIVQMGYASEGEPEDLVNSARAEVDSVQTRGSGPLTTRTLGSVLEEPDEHDWVIDGLMERRERFMLTGQEGQGKSVIIRQMAILSAAGIHPFTFKEMAPAKVLVVDVENSTRQWRRSARPMVMRAALRGSVNPGDVLELSCVEKQFDITRDLGNVLRLMDQHQPDLVAIGPLYKMIPGEVNTDAEAAAVLGALDQIRDRGAALLIEAHAGHGVGKDRERDLRPRGSSALLGWPEFGMGLRFAGKGEFSLVRWRGDRDRRNWPIRMRRAVHENEWSWVPTAFTFQSIEEPTP